MYEQQPILEAIVTTTRHDGGVNVAPMGPRVAEDFGSFLLRPFPSSETFLNLARTRQGVLHVTDDVELFARAAIDQWDQPPAVRPAEAVEGFILADACRWYAFRVDEIDDRRERAELACRVVDRGWQRDFFGFHRARHAVIEAAIVATRLEFLPAEVIRRRLEESAELVQKTGGPHERAALDLIEEYVRAANAAKAT